MTTGDAEYENMLCDRCTSAFQEPKFSRVSSFNLRWLRNDRDLQVLHPNFASLQAALKAECGFCHRLVNALISKKRSQILSDLQLYPGIAPESFSLQYRFAYESDTRRYISCLAVFRAEKAGKELRETCREDLFLSTGN